MKIIGHSYTKTPKIIISFAMYYKINFVRKSQIMFTVEFKSKIITNQKYPFKPIIFIR